MWFLPSRGRPKILARFFEQALSTGMSTPGHVWIDDDDPLRWEYMNLKIPHDWTMGLHQRIGLGPSFNHLLQSYWYEPWFGWLGDDAMPMTPAWDAILVADAGTEGIAYANDGINDGAKRCCHGVMGGNLARDLGFIMVPGLIRLYMDDALYEIGMARNCIQYSRDVVIDHWHFSNGKAEYDKTYEKPEAAADQAHYERWKTEFDKNPNI